MNPRAFPTRCEPARGCITCMDEAVRVRVVATGPDEGLAVCADAEGRRGEVLTGLVGAVAVGDVLLVHAGAALLRLEPSGEGVR